ncbi:MAG: hypothetical protein KA765_15495, partial [Thermoflexales bacterium]|nr:hypothetical protein [Thermoflexales bacterium]
IVGWTPGSDGSGLAGYWVGWNTSPTSTLGTVFIPAGTVYSYTQVISEAQAVYAHVVSVDAHGNRLEQVSEPVYVDTPLTPDLVGQVGNVTYRGWLNSSCTELGVNRSVAEHALSGASLHEAQTFYTTWNADTLRLAWDGANWATEGDLFVYLDYQPGGATQLYNPYSATISNTTIYLPGNLPPAPMGTLPAFETVRQSLLITPLLGTQMQADALVWVKDARTAVLMTWNGLNWTTAMTLTADQYQLENGLTDLAVPFSVLGINTPATTSLTLLAAASQKAALRLWAVMPERNPLNDAPVVDPLAAVAASQVFPLTSAYHWPALGPGQCPYQQTWLQPPATPGYVDSSLRASLSVEPLGTTYSLMGDDLFWQWQTLFQGSGPRSQQFDFLDHNHPPLADGQTITYTLRIDNQGTATATEVKALMSAYYALSLPGGTRDTAGYRDYQIVAVGSVAPGATVTRTFTGTVMVDANWRYTQCLTSLPAATCEPLRNYALIDGLIFDSFRPLTTTIDIPAQSPFEWVWADHAVDTLPPQFIGLSAPQFAVRTGGNVIQGYAADPSGVPLIEVQVRDPLSNTITLACPDSTPYDGRWACDWTVAGNDGEEFALRARATDRLGHVGAWTAPWRNLIVDSVPPTITLDADAFTAVNGQIIGPSGALLTGALGDNHSGGQALVCDEVNCVKATTLTAAQVPTTTALYYTDAPSPTLPITTTTFCGGGEITRTFYVSDSFIVGETGLGFTAFHPNREEIVVDLISPAGTRARVIEPSGTLYGFANYDVWLSDAAPQPLHRAVDDAVNEPYFKRAAQPDTPLSVFNGEVASGVWQVQICDLNPLTNNGAYHRSRLSLSPQGAALSTAGTWAYALPTFAAADGLMQTLTIYGQDGLGHRTASPISVTYQLDTVPPVLSVTTVVTHTSQTSPTVVLAGQVSDGGGLNGLYVRVDPPEGAAYRDGVNLSGANWSYTPRPAWPGTYIYRLEAYDLAGNVSTLGEYAVAVSGLKYVYLPLIRRN